MQHRIYLLVQRKDDDFIINWSVTEYSLNQIYYIIPLHLFAYTINISKSLQKVINKWGMG